MHDKIEQAVEFIEKVNRKVEQTATKALEFIDDFRNTIGTAFLGLFVTMFCSAMLEMMFGTEVVYFFTFAVYTWVLISVAIQDYRRNY